MEKNHEKWNQSDFNTQQTFECVAGYQKTGQNSNYKSKKSRDMHQKLTNHQERTRRDCSAPGAVAR